MPFIILFGIIVSCKSHATAHYTMLNFDDLKLNIVIGIDKLSRLMGIFILIIASFIFQYAVNYLKSDSRQPIFLFQFILVVLSALLLSLAQNLVTAFIAWQLIGITLYLLLNYYHNDPNANKSAKKKFVLNRLGDCTFLTAIIIALHDQGTTAFNNIQYSPESTLIATLLFISVLTKCAQFPFHIWLLDTMEAPTPVSALMHAGIINSGGILLTRISGLLIKNEFLLITIMSFSLITILLTGYWRKKQPDIKKQLAYSTSAQMGYMIMQCSVGAFPAAILHLITHGFFKASLFLDSGSTLYTKTITTKNHTPGTRFNVFLVSILISMICFYFVNYINITLPPIIIAFLFITIYTCVKHIRDTSEKKITQALQIILITLFVFMYILLLKSITIYLIKYQVTQNIISIKTQIIGITLFGLAWFTLNSKYSGRLFRQDFTEAMLRKYALNPIRLIGEKVSSSLDHAKNSMIALFFVVGAFIISLLINYSLTTPSVPHINVIIFSLLTLNIIFLLAANRAHGLNKLVIMLLLYHIIFICYALLHHSSNLNKIIIFFMINLTPALLWLYYFAKSEKNLPKYYLTASLLLLIGIPGSASFISEIALLSAMYKLGYLYLFLYLTGIILLSLTIMHALQIYSFGVICDDKNLTEKSIYHHVVFAGIIAINIIFGIFPHLLLSQL